MITGCDAGIYFPAVGSKDTRSGLMIESVMLPFDKNIVGLSTLNAIGCGEAVCGIHDAFLAAHSCGLLGSINRGYGFSDRSIQRLGDDRLYLIGDSLSLSVFVSLIFAAFDKRPRLPIAVTGAIHVNGTQYECRPVAAIDEKIELILSKGFRRAYVPIENASSYVKPSECGLELIPVPSDLRNVIDLIIEIETLA